MEKRAASPGTTVFGGLGSWPGVFFFSLNTNFRCRRGRGHGGIRWLSSPTCTRTGTYSKGGISVLWSSAGWCLHFSRDV